jgi:uncharacterized phage-associated protein
MPSNIKFRVNEDKILETLVYIAKKRPRIDVFHVCKVLYFADKDHLNRYGRPILGDTYFALHQGPVPTLAYDMIERDERHLFGIMLEKLSNSLAYSKTKTDNYLRIIAKRDASIDLFSESDLECLDASISAYADMDVKQLTDLVHAEPAYKAVYREGRKPSPIGYELIIDVTNPLHDEILADIREHAALVIL